ncbi:hypothetical protein F0342_21580 [Bacillus sp. CH30_1T]|uniref:hypothetical protein n=1 Tax=Bacillus sp. CH30_1T TaxID=2604836 RepID=UPI0011ED20E6|nr:hypothetical protein [Bacillus sp. CH30_1T]KAA0560755.1 hypothetical protein F0342_21580 [Bacillus sp. CH30_1T]
MNGTHIQYAKAVGKIGEAVSKTGNKFGEVSERQMKTPEEIVKAKNDYDILIKELKRQKRKLENIIPPSPVKDQHAELINNYQQFIVGTEAMNTAWDFENATLNEEQFAKGKEAQQESSKNIKQISETIADILF